MSRRDHAVPIRRRDTIGPALCVLGALCMLAGLSVGLGGSVSKGLMLVAVVLFVPGAYATLALVRRSGGSQN